MMSDSVLSHFIGALSQMSSPELYELAAIFRNSDRREAAINVITGLAALKSEESEGKRSTTQARVQPASNSVIAISARSKPGEGDRLRSAFFAVLSDKAEFPSIEDVVTAINECFGFNWRYSELNRDSRSRVLARAWKTLTALPEKERGEKLRSFWDRYKRFESLDAYKELFKILSRDE